MPRPVQVALRVGLGLHRGERVVPDAGSLPASEARIRRLPWPVPLRQVAPWGARAYPPEDGFHHRPMVTTRASRRWPLGRQMGRQLPPLLVRQFASFVHPPSVQPLCKHALVINLPPFPAKLGEGMAARSSNVRSRFLPTSLEECPTWLQRELAMRST